MKEDSVDASSKLVLYGARTGNSLRAAVGLVEAGLIFEALRVDLRGGEQRSEAFLKMNPAGQVPVLRVEHRAASSPLLLSQSNAILMYAAEHSQGRLLPGVADPDRSKILEAFFFFSSDVIGPSGAVFILRARGATDAADMLVDRYMSFVRKSERFLTSAGFMGGRELSIADVAGYTIIRSFADSVPWHELTRLAAWYKQMDARPGIRVGMALFG